MHDRVKYALTYIKASQDQMGNPAFTEIIRRNVLDATDFALAPASTKHHHVYEGGLAVHTAEVCYFAKLGSPFLESKERQDLVSAAIMHDMMKVRDYKRVMDSSGPYDVPVHPAAWEKTDYAKKIYHIVGGPIQIAYELGWDGLPANHVDIVHMMLAHHGRKEYGSPVEPQTAGAILLNTADNLSLKLGLVNHIEEKERIQLWQVTT